MPSARPDVSVIVLSWNTRGYLRRCLASFFSPADPEVAAAWLAAGSDAPDPAGVEGVAWELLVVDQESLDQSPEMVEADFPQVRLIRQKPNLGFAGGNNVAIPHAGGRYLVFLNSDTVVRPGWLTELVRYADAHPEAAFFGPKLLNPDGSLQYSCRRFPSLGAGLFRHTPLEWFAPNNRFTGDYLMRDWDHAEPRNVDWLSGACLMVRREVIDQIGPWDEGYFMYFEDVDWAQRAHRAGWEVHYVPLRSIIHEVGRSSDRRPRRLIVMHHESAYRFFCRYSKLGRSAPERSILAAGLAARALMTLGRNEGIKLAARFRGLLRPKKGAAN